MRTGVSVLHTYTREGYQKKEDYEEHERERSVLCIKGKGGAGCTASCCGGKAAAGFGKTDSVQDATEQVGISRSSFYKYKDDIFRFMRQQRGRQSPWSSIWTMSRAAVDCAQDGGRVSRQYPDDPSKYSDQRHRISDTLGRCSAGDGRCDTDGGEHRGARQGYIM